VEIRSSGTGIRRLTWATSETVVKAMAFRSSSCATAGLAIVRLSSNTSLAGLRRYFIGLPAHGTARLPGNEFGSILQQMLPTMPVLPAHKYFSVNNLGFEPYHGMEALAIRKPIKCGASQSERQYKRRTGRSGHPQCDRLLLGTTNTRPSYRRNRPKSS
jgi:hypothetical protein